ncbi:adenylate/guanylate cyclase domain-containing protein [Vineibacter terrae]|uniref:Adenylate/guanylate cyclase domain-containing protein n=1 Tax=Vineibacter terrae TaxID=2586908 RepID=A0A5C8PF21_9HYPH|nr:adenylate/guanylate cyclase domain-containing protein [Vineibacter terrae]TXL71877.1 adenylate/guanylate cyclase domain-containing protein [Vineibacter terrae]
MVSTQSSAGVAALKSWLVQQALLATPVPRIAARFADDLLALGVPLWRAHVGISTVHPQIESIGLTWTRQGKRQLEEFEHGSFARIANSSPFYDAVSAAHVLAQARAEDAQETVIPMIRHRLERGEGPQSYPLLAEFHAAGGTDYLCFVIVYGNDGRLDGSPGGAAVSFTTDRPGGFSDGEIAIIDDLLPAFGAALRVSADLRKTRTLLETYLGGDVGRRVLSGEVRRGSVEAMSAAIIVGDLRGFTVLADTVPRDQLVSMLDDYLDCLVRPVETSNGQVLKFLGDGLLATFPFEAKEPELVCRDALAAATAALQRIDALNSRRRQDGMPTMTLDLALHAGEVLYGNVGSDHRLDFTIVGPAVNEAARLEALCATLDVPLLASRRFVDLAGIPQHFRSLGRHALRGVRAPVEVFALR